MFGTKSKLKVTYLHLFIWFINKSSNECEYVREIKPVQFVEPDCVPVILQNRPFVELPSEPSTELCSILEMQTRRSGALGPGNNTIVRPSLGPSTGAPFSGRGQSGAPVAVSGATGRPSSCSPAPASLGTGAAGSNHRTIHRPSRRRRRAHVGPDPSSATRQSGAVTPPDQPRRDRV